MDKSAATNSATADGQNEAATAAGCGSSSSNTTSNNNALQRLATTTTSAVAASPMMINLNISTTTGGNFGVSVEPHISVESLKKIIAKKLKVVKDRIRLLHREKELQDGTLRDHNLMDGSKIILIPNVETGLLISGFYFNTGCYS
ncbi:midnolin homolog [Drosophila ficusphila]|uniref:midnolin homolog n=1 Tax=Drosophila ficusphila TaxID=30025 RepID=UPI001C8AF805|nr:midnolin homolog [Drosophila ficusphila]